MTSDNHHAQESRKPFDKTLGIGLIISAVLAIPGIIILASKPDQNSLYISTFLGVIALIIVSILFFRTFVRVADSYLDDNIQKESTK